MLPLLLPRLPPRVRTGLLPARFSVHAAAATAASRRLLVHGAGLPATPATAQALARHLSSSAAPPPPPSAKPKPVAAAADVDDVVHVTTGAAVDAKTETELDAPPPPAGPIENPDYARGTIWLDNIFPFKWGSLLDPRTLLIRRYADRFVKDEAWRRLIPATFPGNAEFQFREAVPNRKEGGLYLKFKYKGGTIEEAVEAIREHIQTERIRSVFNLAPINAYQVKGRPWIEDMVSRVPSARLHVEFHGPDLTVEQLFREFRNFGRIMDITPQPSTSKEVPRYASVEFVRKRSATSARNCIHGEFIDGTRVFIGYEKKQNPFFFWTWAMANLRISIPIALALAAGITYIVFDPLRVFSITNKITGRFSLEKYAESAEELWSVTSSSLMATLFGGSGKRHHRAARSSIGWEEREKEEKRLEQHFKQTPDSLVLVSGPKGSGKSDLVRKALEHHKNKVVIHCADLVGQLDHVLLSRLASQVGFFPSFGFMTQISTFVDALITATTGAKAGLSTTNEGEIRKILECLTDAVTDLTVKQRAARARALAELANRSADDDVNEPGALLSGGGSGSAVVVPDVEYPVIVIDDYLGKENARGHMLAKVISEWAAVVSTQLRVAHVVFVSDNPAAVRELGKAVPTKSVETFTLRDATPESAMAYVRRRLPEVPAATLRPMLDVLGGRLHDLDLFVQKVKAGQEPENAFKDMVHRSITELRKIGLGEDTDPATTAATHPWSPVQFWKIVSTLSAAPTVPFDALVAHPVFRLDATPLHLMERDGLVVLVHENGRAVSVAPGKPIYRAAFRAMTDDAALVASMGIVTAKTLVKAEEARVRGIEDEMRVLAGVVESAAAGGVLGNAILGSSTHSEVRRRLEFLATLLGESTRKIAAWTDDENKYKKMLKLPEPSS
ncbi:RNA12 protein-domain-containing protein [Entophlyctis helioformis]|nr:RNA12 protein-domain-containing protein [Entophlyctis helioformis]